MKSTIAMIIVLAAGMVACADQTDVKVLRTNAQQGDQTQNARGANGDNTKDASVKSVESSATASLTGSIVFSWKAYTANDEASFKLFFQGGDETSPTLLKEIDHHDAGFDKASPSVTIDLASETALAKYAGKKICFCVVATVDNAESTPSNIQCIDKLGAAQTAN